MSKLSLFELYRGAVTVWVEDEATRELLTIMWRDSQLSVLAAVGTDSVRTLVYSARSSGHPVFGVVDGDLQPGNRSDWNEPDCLVHVLPQHEIENLLLDFDALAALSKQTPTEIKVKSLERARQLRFWLVAKRLLRLIRSEMAADYPSDPPQTLSSQVDVEKWVDSQTFWRTHDQSFATWKAPQHRAQQLQSITHDVEQALTSDAWMELFPGKELLRDLRARVRGLDRSPSSNLTTSSERDLDLIKLVARHMRDNNSTPPVLTELKGAIRKKGGLA